MDVDYLKRKFNKGKIFLAVSIFGLMLSALACLMLAGTTRSSLGVVLLWINLVSVGLNLWSVWKAAKFMFQLVGRRCWMKKGYHYVGVTVLCVIPTMVLSVIRDFFIAKGVGLYLFIGMLILSGFIMYNLFVALIYLWTVPTLRKSEE